MNLRCPICNEQLNLADRQYVCPNRHGFDIARQGYVNLLTVQQKHSLNPGDTREQVLSRREFLEAGYYAPIAKKVAEILIDELDNGRTETVTAVFDGSMKVRGSTGPAPK